MDFDLPAIVVQNGPQDEAAGTFTIDQVAGRYSDDDGLTLTLNRDGTLDAPFEWTAGRCAEDYDFDRGRWSITGIGGQFLDITLEYSIGPMEHRYISYMPRTDSASDGAIIGRNSHGEIELKFINGNRFVRLGDQPTGTE